MQKPRNNTAVTIDNTWNKAAKDISSIQNKAHGGTGEFCRSILYK
jgi:hypothetical protein